jgi:hypothetical protein
MSKQYLVEWRIDIEADSPREAAEEAFRIMQEPDTSATCFDVIEKDGDGSSTYVDLSIEDDDDDMEEEDNLNPDWDGTLYDNDSDPG